MLDSPEARVEREISQGQFTGRLLLALVAMCPIVGALFLAASSYTAVATKLDAAQDSIKEFRTETREALKKMEVKLEGLDGRQWTAAQERIQLLSRMQELERRMERQDTPKRSGGG